MDLQTFTTHRREMILMAAGVAMLIVGKLADSSVNGTAFADESGLSHATERLQNIPAVIGHWTSVDYELGPREIDSAGIEGYIRREYQNRRTGATVYLTVLCGHSGPMAVHPPTACFEGIGYSLNSGPSIVRVTPPDSEAAFELNRSSFKQNDAAVPEIVRVFWGWSPSGVWQAPSSPRITFRGRPYLYKIYITDRDIDRRKDSIRPQAEAFLDQALPVIQDALNPQDSLPRSVDDA